MPRPLLIASTALLVILAGAAGCSSGSAPGGTSTTPAPSQAMITWVDSVCSADSDLRAQQGAARTAALSMVPRQPTRQQIAGFIAAVRTNLSESLATFQKLRTGVVDGGDRVIDAYVTAITGALAKIDPAEKIANDASQPDLMVTSLPQGVANIVEAAVPVDADLPGLVDTDPTLRAAYQRTKSCQDARPLTTADHSPAPTTSR